MDNFHQQFTVTPYENLYRIGILDMNWSCTIFVPFFEMVYFWHTLPVLGWFDKKYQYKPGIQLMYSDFVKRGVTYQMCTNLTVSFSLWYWICTRSTLCHILMYWLCTGFRLREKTPHFLRTGSVPNWNLVSELIFMCTVFVQDSDLEKIGLPSVYWNVPNLDLASLLLLLHACYVLDSDLNSWCELLIV